MAAEVAAAGATLVSALLPPAPAAGILVAPGATGVESFVEAPFVETETGCCAGWVASVLLGLGTGAKGTPGLVPSPLAASRGSGAGVARRISAKAGILPASRCITRAVRRG